MPEWARCFVPASINGAGLGLIGTWLNLGHDLVAERGNLRFGFRHEATHPAADGGTMREAHKAESLAQAPILL